MRLIFLRSKWVLGSAVFILLFALVVLTIIAFTSVISNSKTVDLCAKFSNDPGKINCEEAAKRAITDTKGSIRNIAIGLLAPNLALERTPGNSKKQMWLIDIDLEKPFTSPNGKGIKSLRIGIPIDGTDALYRIPIKT